jgi:hypothetical protein
VTHLIGRKAERLARLNQSVFRPWFSAVAKDRADGKLLDLPQDDLTRFVGQADDALFPVAFRVIFGEDELTTIQIATLDNALSFAVGGLGSD